MFGFQNLMSNEFYNRAISKSPYLTMFIFPNKIEQSEAKRDENKIN